MNKLLRVAPILALFILSIALAVGLFRHEQQKKLDTSHNGEQFAKFSVAMLMDGSGQFSNEIFAGQVAVVDVFSSWCDACLAEHKLLINLADSGKVNVYGLAWKDTPEKITEYLNKNGNPFKAVGVDKIGEVTALFGLTSAPETFVIDKAGKIAFHYKAALTEDTIKNTILPLVEELNKS